MSMPHDNVHVIRRVLVSVSDKTHIAEFAQFLVNQGIEILATGGTAKLLREQHIPLTELSEYTGYPEIMGGRIKTLHPKVHGGLLGRKPIDSTVMQEQGIESIDLLIVNLYPFAETVKTAADNVEKCIENIDAGGPAMIRAAAKNHARVTVVVSPDDYSLVQANIETQGGLSLTLRRQFAAKAFQMTAAYDAAIAQWFERNSSADLPDKLALMVNKTATLRYGENPHQKAAFYQHESGSMLPGVSQLMGKELSFNNIVDTSVAAECVAEFDQPACVIVKHAVPCGVACGEGIMQAWSRALESDPVSAFGGIIALNRRLDEALARAMVDSQFVEVVIAPEVDAAALSLLAKKPSLRVLQGRFCDDGIYVRSVAGGYLVQEQDTKKITENDFQVKTKRQPTAAEIADLLFAWRVVKYVKSNAIVFASRGSVTGVGSGQTSRVDSVSIAARKTLEFHGQKTEIVMASDAFFPFADSLAIAHDHGISAIIQPGGSKNDHELIAAADRYGMAMVFSGIRHFRH